MATKKVKIVNTSPRVLFLENSVRLVPNEPVEVDAEVLKHEDYAPLFESGDIKEYTAPKGKAAKASKAEAPNPNPSTGGDA